MRRPLAPFVVFAALSVAACSDSDAAPSTAPPTAITASTTDPATTTTSDVTIATTSSIAPTTEPPETTSATTTTGSPPTTVDPIAEIEAAVRQARLDGEAAYVRAAMDPPNLDLRAVLLSYVSLERFEVLQEFISGLEADGLRLRPSLQTPSSVTFVSEVELPEGAKSSQAFVDVCRVDSDVVYRPLESGQELIIDDVITTTLSRIQMSLIDGTWIFTDSVRIATWAGTNSCDDS